MLVNLPTHDRTLRKSSGRSQATVHEQIPPLEMPAIADDRFEARGKLRGGTYQVDPAPSVKRHFGGGIVQHVAWGCAPQDLDAWSARVAPLCPDATGTVDRHFFRSTYFTEPGGVLFEIAEHGGPGFAAGEPDGQHMGDALALPPWLEERRTAWYAAIDVPSKVERLIRRATAASAPIARSKIGIGPLRFGLRPAPEDPEGALRAALDAVYSSPHASTLDAIAIDYYDPVASNHVRLPGHMTAGGRSMEPGREIWDDIVYPPGLHTYMRANHEC